MQRNFDLAPEEWATLRRLLGGALELPPAARETWVERLSGDDAAFKPRLRALLAHAQGTSVERLLQTLPKIETDAFAERRPGSDSGEAGEPGQHVGPYRLLRQIGEGGMASVWLAERSDLLQGRQVALKLPHGTWRRAAWAARLAREREILATLEHPNIARLYDAGVAVDGQPYLALEYVEGERIDVHCRERGFDVRQRLQLFLQVVHAVAHAHAKLVVHRDLKPSNILIGPDGQARLLDFGIAKLLEQGFAQETELTLETGRALTPEYAAPEQIRGEPISTGTDIYSLGVLLFELLTGERPYRVHAGSRAELEAAILRVEPPRASTVAADLQSRKRLRGDLDTIVMKALKKAPGERYGTAMALADDIERWLNQRPILAQPDSARYRATKFIVRNKLPVGAAAAVFVAVLGGAGVAVWQGQTALAEKRRAEAVKAFVTSIFNDANPWIGQQTKPTAAQLLTQARERLGEQFKDEPLIRIELLNTLGESLISLQEPEAAESLVRQAMHEAGTRLQPGHPYRLRAHYLLMQTYAVRFRTADMARELDVLLPAMKRDPVLFREEIGLSLTNLVQAANDEGDYAEMERRARSALEFSTEYLGERHPTRMRSLLLLGNAHENLEQFETAEAFAAQAYTMAQEIYRDQPQHPQLADSRFIYARILHKAGHPARALPLMKQSIEDAGRLFGPDSLRVGAMVRTMSAPLLELQRLPEALEASERGLRILAGHFPADSVHYAYALVARGSIRMALRHAAPAFDDYDKAWATLRPPLGPEHRYALRVRQQRGLALAYIGKTDEALGELRDILEKHRKQGLPGLGGVLHTMAVVQRLAGMSHDAIATLSLAAEHSATDGDRERVALETGLNQLALGELAKALEALQRADSFAADRSLPLTPLRVDVLLGMGRAWLEHGKPDKALPLLQRADAFWREQGARHRWAGEAAFWLGKCHAAMGERKQAKEAFARAAADLAGSPFAFDVPLWRAARNS